VISIAAPVIESDEIEAVRKVLESGMLAQGARVEEFEEAFAAYIGTKYAVATSSGTAALHIALLASGIRSGDQVITTPFSFVATGNAVLFCGAKPVFVDIEENTFNISPDLIRNRITPRTKAVLAVHLYGQPCELEQIVEICQDHNLVLIEDACQAHGAEYRGRRVGSFGVGCFSFYPTKNMTTGEGGMITTNDEYVAKRARMIRDHGQDGRYNHEIMGYNYRLTDLGAAIGVCQLRKLDQFNQKRIENAAYLADEIKNIRGLVPPYVGPNVKHVFHQFTVRVTEDFGVSRDALQRRLSEMGIGSAIHYGRLICQQRLYSDLGYDKRLPVAERAAREVLCLPVHPRLVKDDLKEIAEALRNV
jgi:perosamine synthetase